MKAGAKLALSCLTEAQALRLVEIQQAITQCKEISEDMLIQALCSIKNSFKNGGLSSDILFEAARHWAELSRVYSEKEAKEFNKFNNNKRKLNHQQPFVGGNMGGNLLIDYNCRINNLNNLNSQLLLQQSPNALSALPVPFQACAVLPPYADYSAFPPPPPQVYQPQAPNLLPPNFNNLTLPLSNNYNPYAMAPMTPGMFKNYQASFNQLNKQQQHQQNYLLNQQRFFNQSNMLNNFSNFNTNPNRSKQNQQQLQPPPPFMSMIPAHPPIINQHLPFNAYQATVQQNNQLKSETYLINAYTLGKSY